MALTLDPVGNGQHGVIPTLDGIIGDVVTSDVMTLAYWGPRRTPSIPHPSQNKVRSRLR